MYVALFDRRLVTYKSNQVKKLWSGLTNCQNFNFLNLFKIRFRPFWVILDTLFWWIFFGGVLSYLWTNFYSNFYVHIRVSFSSVVSTTNYVKFYVFANNIIVKLRSRSQLRSRRSNGPRSKDDIQDEGDLLSSSGQVRSRLSLVKVWFSLQLEINGCWLLSMLGWPMQNHTWFRNHRSILPTDIFIVFV